MTAVPAIMAAALVTEDGALLAAAGLWATGRLDFAPAFFGVLAGIALGDLGLYVLGYAAGPRLARYQWMRSDRWEDLGRRLGLGRPAFVAVARVLPGARLSGYVASGVLRAPFGPFAASVCLSALLWVLFWFGLAGPLGSRLPAATLLALLVACFVAFTWLARGFYGREWRLRLIGLQRLRWPEFWPVWLFYPPVTLYYAWLGLRMRGFLLPTLSNPGIDNGGMINESKDAIFRLLPRHKAVLAWRLHEPGSRPRATAFPLVAKPDAGQRGSGVRLLRSQAELDAYARKADYRFLTQEYCGYPFEAGVFYVRRPGEKQGRLFSLTRKVFPSVLGDGKSTLADLILADPRNRYMARVLFKRHAGRLEEHIPTGERVRLVESGNHCQGTVFLDGRKLAGEGLRREIDRIARAMPGFYVGRFDLRYENDRDFSRGRGFKIIEVNGASSEATHVYDPSVPLMEIYRTLFEQWRLVFEIGAENRRLGLKETSLGEFLRGFLAYRRSSRRHPLAS